VPFSSFGLDPLLLRGVRELGFSRPTPIQEQSIPPAMAGRDVLACAATGSGKTAAFGLPILHRLMGKPRRTTRALVLTPTRELCAQIDAHLQELAVHTPVTSAAVFGGVGMGPQEHALRAGVDVIVATPGRLLDHFRHPYARLAGLEVLVLDEADRMLDMGFLPDVTRILEMLRPDRQTMLFSATLDGEVGRLAKRFTRDAVLHENGEPGPNINHATHRFIAVEHPQKTRALVRELAAERGLTLIFVRTQRGADRLARNLRKEGFSAGELHGGMSQPQRERALGRFASGANDVLVATDVAARGLDLEDITHVINFDAPADDKAYVHRVGRTARAGRGGEGVTFVTPDQRLEVGRIAKRLDLHAEFVQAGLSKPAPHQGGNGQARSPKGGNTHRRRQDRRGAPDGRGRPAR